MAVSDSRHKVVGTILPQPYGQRAVIDHPQGGFRITVYGSPDVPAPELPNALDTDPRPALSFVVKTNRFRPDVAVAIIDSGEPARAEGREEQRVPHTEQS